MRLSEWAARNGVHYQTAWTRAKEGRMPVPVRQTPSGTWLVDGPSVEASGRVVAYCCVSLADQKPDLDRQVARVVQGVTGLGLPVTEVVTEVGSGLSGRRLVVLDPAESADDLVRDVTEVLTSMCARLYGRRGAKKRAARAVVVAVGEAAG
ncbi:IS607 family transposase [Streptomyces sp. NBC_01474]|uniref:IS607 family transposase n=1 Tax=Streptomyces sp. NBC_01474 TaxID=2903880 RepID=UPI002DD7B971|nr:IS607 family transposase [Streptomyces sp. NBC_01474]WSE00584.1 IS607 family transposase [Streptomyces sp. NBC_01474]